MLGRMNRRDQKKCCSKDKLLESRIANWVVMLHEPLPEKKTKPHSFSWTDDERQFQSHSPIDLKIA